MVPIELYVKPFTLPRKIAWALGATGWTIGDRLLMTWGLFVFAPPAGEDLPQRLPAWSLLGVLTVWGVINLLARFVDGVSDPLVAAMSDRSTHRWGRRRVFMVVGIVPLTVATGALFFAPTLAPSWGNAVFAAVVLTAYFVAFTVYACPYQALLPDLARSETDRVNLSTLQAALMLVGAALVMVGSPLLLGALHDVAPVSRYQIMGVTFALVAFVFMLAPIVAVSERELVAAPRPSNQPILASVRATLRAPGMGWYLLATISFWFGFNAIASGVPYFVTVLMGREVEFAGTVLTVTFAVTAVFFPVVAKVAHRFGKRRTMIGGAAGLCLVMVTLPLVHDTLSGLLVLGLAGIPIAALMALPNAMLADLAHAEAKRTGENGEAMFFGAQAFFMKVNLGLSSAALAALLPLGNSIDNPLGVQLIGPATVVTSLISVFAYWRFREPGDQATATVVRAQA